MLRVSSQAALIAVAAHLLVALSTVLLGAFGLLHVICKIRTIPG
jgi:hypothetical protein